MRTIHSLSLMLIIAFCFLAFNHSPLKTIPVQKTDIEILFNEKQSFDDLVNIRKGLSDKGILLDYSKLDFDKKGSLRSISFSVDCKDGFIGSATGSFPQKNMRFGFQRNYSANAKTPFATGYFK